MPEKNSVNSTQDKKGGLFSFHTRPQNPSASHYLPYLEKASKEKTLEEFVMKSALAFGTALVFLFNFWAIAWVVEWSCAFGELMHLPIPSICSR